MTAVMAFGTTRVAQAQEPAAPLQWPDTPPPPTPARAPAPAVDTSPPRFDRDRVREVLNDDPDISAAYRRGRGLVIAGAVSVGSSGASLLLAGVFALNASSSGPTYEDDPEYAANRPVDPAALGFAITSLVLLGVGVPMLAVGIRDRRAAIRDARRKVGLANGPHGFGLRF